MQKIRKGDKVIVIAGRDKGRKGVVLKVNPKQSTAIVQGVNIVKRHQRQTKTQEAGIISKEAAIHLSNVAYLDPKEDRPTRIGFIIEDGKKIRIAKRSGERIDG